MKAEEHIKIPIARIAVVIGKNGEIKNKIENLTQTSIEIDSKDGIVHIINTPEAENPLAVWKARDIIKAIGRGFSPERALFLLDEESYLEIIDLTTFFGRNEKAIKRIKGRIIGEAGKTRRLIEETTETAISVYGTTISLIGALKSLKIGKKAVTMLINGISHGTVYQFLYRKRREMKKDRTDLWKVAPF
ncbi:MAG: RNA-processing protein [Candidatus Helarchaeota archaeon]|nr:RNA-processing protein [Candidatus Helarchaeota archaeon]